MINDILKIRSAIMRQRLNCNYSNESVAFALGLSVDEYISLEVGPAIPTATQMLQLVRFYGSTLDAMYGLV